MSAVCIPFLRDIDGVWTFVWENYHDKAYSWRTHLKNHYQVRPDKELHGNELASARGRFKLGKQRFNHQEARIVYKAALQSLTFLPDASVMTVASQPNSELFGNTRLEASLYGLLQRLRTKFEREHKNGLIFFDDGHDEYRLLYRKARVTLETGSAFGVWNDGSRTKNLPLDMFTKDGNIKVSRNSQFTQIADLVAYAATVKLRAGTGAMTEWQKAHGFESLYDDLPGDILNVHVSNTGDGIKRLPEYKTAERALPAV